MTTIARSVTMLCPEWCRQEEHQGQDPYVNADEQLIVDHYAAARMEQRHPPPVTKRRCGATNWTSCSSRSKRTTQRGTGVCGRCSSHRLGAVLPQQIR
jgi:hypothetical protein